MKLADRCVNYTLRYTGVLLERTRVRHDSLILSLLSGRNRIPTISNYLLPLWGNVL